MSDRPIPPPAPTDQRAFANMLRSLFNIDGYQLPELTSEQQLAFVRDPVRYFIRAGKAQQDAIWREVAKRQPPEPTYGGIPLSAHAQSGGIAGWHPGDDA